MIQPLPYVARISPYVPGKPVKELERELGISSCVKLASNENPHGPSPKAIAALQQLLAGSGELGRYPEGSGYYLKTALAVKLSLGGIPVGFDNLILGNGSNELLDLAARTYMGPGDEAVMSQMSFVVYSSAVQSVGGIAHQVPMTDYRHDLERMADAITPKTRIVFIANPNNPTGTTNSAGEFDRFMQRVPENILVIVDEAYIEYVTRTDYPNTLRYFGEGRDVLLLRTFSKIYGLASLRIGYGIASEGIVTAINRLREPFNTNTPAQIAAEHALADEDHVRRSIENNEAGKKYLMKELAAAGMLAVPSEANFIFVPLATESMPLFEALLRKGVIIRPAGPKAVRITIGLPHENERFIAALKEVMSA
ncbi:MAG TPA: histidinol-phosphate transaminase [Dissulfurispiraceae bacterium]|nr:histidinol-phosphate transaminase [Dissulfurispiraceae bacterium]